MGGPQGRCLMPQCGRKTWLKVLGLSSTSYSPGKFLKKLAKPGIVLLKGVNPGIEPVKDSSLSSSHFGGVYHCPRGLRYASLGSRFVTEWRAGCTMAQHRHVAIFSDLTTDTA